MQWILSRPGFNYTPSGWLVQINRCSMTGYMPGFLPLGRRSGTDAGLRVVLACGGPSALESGGWNRADGSATVSG
jgi:hypothetical protein